MEKIYNNIFTLNRLLKFRTNGIYIRLTKKITESTDLRDYYKKLLKELELRQNRNIIWKKKLFSISPYSVKRSLKKAKETYKNHATNEELLNTGFDLEFARAKVWNFDLWNINIIRILENTKCIENLTKMQMKYTSFNINKLNKNIKYLQRLIKKTDKVSLDETSENVFKNNEIWAFIDSRFDKFCVKEKKYLEKKKGLYDQLSKIIIKF